MASLYQRRKDYRRAIELSREALKIRQELLGEQHPIVAFDYAQLAGLSLLQGRPADALELQQQALKVEQVNLERVFGFTSEPAMRLYLDKVSSSLDALVNIAGDRPGGGGGGPQLDLAGAGR